ncbi:MAG TPA: PAS domain-containing protein [Deltaproteobacteria bacterium]|nr:PAS domain-containing protein [Deltaproteobacteria bacterium]
MWTDKSTTSQHISSRDRDRGYGGDSSTRYLEKRLRYFEESSRFILDTLELATSLGDCRESVNQLKSVFPILDDAEAKLADLIPFEAFTFYLVNEENNDFEHVRTRPVETTRYAKDETEFLIDSGVFAWAVREKRPVVVTSRSKDRRFVLHALSTRSRTRGMFVGTIADNRRISDIHLSLLSLVLLTTAGAVESFYLYGMLRGKDREVNAMKGYRLLFESAFEGMEILDAGGRIVDCNEAMCGMLESEKEHLIGRLASHFFSGNREDRSDNHNVFPKKGSRDDEVELVSAKGTVLRVYRRERPLFGEDRFFEGSIVSYRHITAGDTDTRK